MRKLLDNLYESIKEYEVEKDKNKEEIEKITNEIDEISTSLNSSNNLNKLEKMKKQMDLSYLQSKLELIEMKKENSSNSELINFQEDINLEIKKIEDAIYLSTRFNNLQYVNALQKMRENKVKDTYNISEIKKYFNNNLSDRDKKVTLVEILPEFNSIYEYYEKVSDTENEIIKSLNKEKSEIDKKIEKFSKTGLFSFAYVGDSNEQKIKQKEEEKRIKLEKEKKVLIEKVAIHKQRLNMLEELVDEMAVEIIKEDMKKNNVTLPDFVKGMRYFKFEDEENTENSKIVD